jgi:hypothetical protein
MDARDEGRRPQPRKGELPRREHGLQDVVEEPSRSKRGSSFDDYWSPFLESRVGRRVVSLRCAGEQDQLRLRLRRGCSATD